MGLHKLSAGDGYAYLTRQVAAHDSTEKGHTSLGDYYSQQGEAPGRWLGAGLAGLELAVGDEVSAAQMKALFGEGVHPDAAVIGQAVIAAGGTVAEARRAYALGRAYAVYDGAGPLQVAVAKAFTAYNVDRGLKWNTAIPLDTRAAIRSRIGREMFTATFGRPPADARELSGFIARESRQATTAVAGFDLTFSPVKSVSTLWAIAPRAVAEQIEAAHHAAVADTLTWLEANATYSRTGRGGVRQVDVRGLVAAAFTHRDSRAGDPDLHTHVAVSNKVQTLDGRWFALDGRVLYKAKVSASERYNTRLEAELTTRLGVHFADRKPPSNTPAPGALNSSVASDGGLSVSGGVRGKRPVREIVGVPRVLSEFWSTRRAAINTRRAQLAAAFQADHGRPPTAVEALALAQQATLETRQAKHAPRSHAQQRATWRAQAIDVLGGEADLARMLATVTRHRTTGHPSTPATPPAAAETDVPPAVRVMDALIGDTARRVVEQVQASRAAWQMWHVRAEAERQVRTLGLGRDDVDAAVDAVTARALAADMSLPLGGHDPVEDPQQLQRVDGSSVYTVAGSRSYTSRAVLDAEAFLLRAARRRGGRTVDTTAVGIALAESAANRFELNPAQAHMVTELATSGARLQLAIAPAGSGKTTAMRVLSQAWTDSGGQVLGLAPSARAAAELRCEIRPSDDATGPSAAGGNQPDQATADRSLTGRAGSTHADTLAKLIHAVTTGMAPRWVRDIGPHSLVIIDEAGMAGTADLATAVRYILDRGASVRLIGDDQQLASVSAGGILRDIAEQVGVITLSQLQRFTDPAEAAATLALRLGDPAAVAFYLDHARVHVGDETTVTDAIYQAWAADHAAGLDSVMLAPTRELVALLNARARTDRLAQLAQRSQLPDEPPGGELIATTVSAQSSSDRATAGRAPSGGRDRSRQRHSRPGQHAAPSQDTVSGREVLLADGNRGSAGDVVITRRNNRDLPISHSDWVKNGDRWTIRAVRASGAIDVRHADTGHVVTLPAGYVREHVELGYAATVHGAQGITADTSHVLASGEESRQVFYVAMTRGRAANHVYLVTAGDGDEHSVITPAALFPPTATDLLTGILHRDQAQRSATTTATDAAQPATLLRDAAARYHDALGFAAEQLLCQLAGPDVLANLDQVAERLWPGLTDAPAYPTLRAHLALLAFTHPDAQPSPVKPRPAPHDPGTDNQNPQESIPKDSTNHHGAPPQSTRSGTGHADRAQLNVGPGEAVELAPVPAGMRWVDPAVLLEAVAGPHARELRTALDPAAVLDWRLDPGGALTRAGGPLRWLPAVPAPLATDPTWGDYLGARATRVRDLAHQVREDAAAWTPITSPAWASRLLGDEHTALRADLAVWRAAVGIADTDRRPTGSPQLAAAAARHQQDLNARLASVLGDPRQATAAWAPLASQISPRILRDEFWPELADRLAALDRAGINPASMLATVARQAPLPDDQPAAALWWRLARHLTPAAATATAHSGADTLRPAWTTTLIDQLGPDRAGRVMTDPAWPALVAAITTAPRDQWTPHTLLATAISLVALPPSRPAAVPEPLSAAASPTDIRTPMNQPSDDTNDGEGGDAPIGHSAVSTTLHSSDYVAEADLAGALVWRVAMLTDPAPLADLDDPFDLPGYDRDDPSALSPPDLHLLPETLTGPGNELETQLDPWFVPARDDIDDRDYAELLAHTTPPVDPYADDHHANHADDASVAADQGEYEALDAGEVLRLDLAHAAYWADVARGPLEPTDAENWAALDAEYAWSLAEVPRQRIIELNQQALDYYTGRFPDSWAAGYLAERLGRDHTLLDAAIAMYRPGYAPAGWAHLTGHLRRLGATDTELLAAGLARRSSRGQLIDAFRDRLTFPLYTPDGDLAGFIARRNPHHDQSDPVPGSPAAMAGPKYLNTATTDLFDKSSQLFGLHQGRAALAHSAQPVLVEGPLDAIAVTLAASTASTASTGNRIALGSHVGVAPLGTAFTDAHAAQLQPYLTDTRTDTNAAVRPAGILVATDADQAGWKAAQRAYWQLVIRGANPHHLDLPTRHDPASVLHERGTSELRRLLTSSRPLAVSLIDDTLASLSSASSPAQSGPDGQGPARPPSTAPSSTALADAASRIGDLIAALPAEQWSSLLDYATDRIAPLAAHLDPDQRRQILGQAILRAAPAWNHEPRHAAAQRITAIGNQPHRTLTPDLTPPAAPTSTARASSRPVDRWRDLVYQHAPDLLNQPDWPALAADLERAAAAGVDLTTDLPRILREGGPLPGQGPVPELRYRLLHHTAAPDPDQNQPTTPADPHTAAARPIQRREPWRPNPSQNQPPTR